MATALKTTNHIVAVTKNAAAAGEILNAINTTRAPISEPTKKLIRSLMGRSAANDFVTALNQAHTALSAQTIKSLAMFLGSDEAARDVAAQLA